MPLMRKIIQARVRDGADILLALVQSSGRFTIGNLYPRVWPHLFASKKVARVFLRRPTSPLSWMVLA